MAGYRARPNAILHRLIDQGFEPTGRGLERATGLAYNTACRVLAGHKLSAETLATIASAFPGSSMDELFEATTPAQPPVQSIRPARRRAQGK